MVALNLRMPDELHRQMTETAKSSYRSLNMEIVHRLHQSLGDQQVQRRNDDETAEEAS
jgi:predicted HicB family RNase H-like nuclease